MAPRIMRTNRGVHVTLSLLLLVCSMSSVQGVSWWNISDAGLRNLPVNEFASLSAEELGSIPPRSFSWILIAQISAIPPEAFSGANSSHLSGLTDSCRGLTASQVGNIRGPAFNGITSRCFNEFTDTTYTGLTSEHVINFSDSVCRGMNQLTRIPNFAFVSITPQCVAVLGGTSCRALSGNMLASIARTSLQALTSSCLNNLAENIFAQSTADLISSLPSSACSGMRARHVANMFAPAAYGFTAECVAQFTWQTCEGLISTVVQNLSPQGVAGLTTTCVGDVPVTGFSTMPAELFAYFNPVACQGFKLEHMRNLPTMAAPYFTPQCIGNFSGGGSSACRGLTADFVALLTPQAIGSIGTNCMWSIRGEVFASLTQQQYAALSPRGCSGLSSHQATFFPLSAATALTKECISAFGFSSAGVCAGFRADFLRAMPVENIRYLSPNCMRNLPSVSMQQLTSEHLRNFNPEGCSDFRLPHLQNLPPTAASGLTAACLQRFSTGYWGACSGLTQFFIGNMSADAFSGFNSTCISDTRRGAFASMNSAQVQKIAPQAFAGFDVLHMLDMSEDVHFVMSVAQIQHLTRRGFSGLRPGPLGALVESNGLPLVNLLPATQIALYPAEFVTQFKSYVPSKVPLMTSWGDVSANLDSASWLQIALLQSPAPLNGEHIVQIAHSTIAGLRADQIQDIHYTHFDRFTPQHAQNFTADMTAAFSSVQLQSLQPNTFGNMSLAGVSGLSASIIPYVTVDQIAQLTRAQMFQMSCSQLNAFTEAQRQVFTPAQNANYQTFRRSCALRAPTTLTNPTNPTISTPLRPTAAPHGGSAGIVETPTVLMPLLVGLLVPGITVLTIVIIVIIIAVKRRQIQRRMNGGVENMVGQPYYVEGSGWMRIVNVDDQNVMMVPYSAMNN